MLVRTVDSGELAKDFTLRGSLFASRSISAKLEFISDRN
jgi:hypothetical protein